MGEAKGPFVKNSGGYNADIRTMPGMWLWLYYDPGLIGMI
jgi:hypothetical protein